MAVVTGIEIGRMRAAVHICDPERMRPAGLSDVQTLEFRYTTNSVLYAVATWRRPPDDLQRVYGSNSLYCWWIAPVESMA
jgi:hypothetical protein